MNQDIRAHLSSELVSQLDPAPGLRVAPSDTVRQVVARMQKERTGCALVCQGQSLCGIFTERDYVRRVLGPGRDPQTPIRDCMTPDPATVRPTDSIVTLIARVDAGGYRRMPVVDEQGSLVGCVSVRNLMHHVAEHCSAAVYNIAPVSRPTQQTREGA